MVWHPNTSLDQVVSEVEVALEAAAKLADPDVLAEFLWRDDPLVRGLYQRSRVAFHLVNGWSEAGEAELESWANNTASTSRVTMAKATIGKYLSPRR